METAQEKFAEWPSDRFSSYYQALLARYLNGASDLPDTLAAFVAPVESLFRASSESTSSVEAVVHLAWFEVIDAVDTSRDEVRASLVNLVLGVQDLGSLTRDHGRQTCIVIGLVVYSDLPYFGLNMREIWNDWPPEVTVDTWRNRNAFAAQLTAARPGPTTDFSLYALWLFREALEDEISSAVPHLPAMMEWFRHAATTLVEHTRRHLSFRYEHGDPAALGPACLESGLTETGFNPARWRFWRQRLGTLVEAGEQTGTLSQQILDRMTSVAPDLADGDA